MSNGPELTEKWLERLDTEGPEGAIPQDGEALIADALRIDPDDRLQLILVTLVLDEDVLLEEVIRKLRARGAARQSLQDFRRDYNRARADYVALQRAESVDCEEPPRVALQYRDFDTLTGFLPAVMGSWLKRHYHIKRGKDDFLYKYNGAGVYEECEDWIRELVRQEHGLSWKAAASEEVIKWLAAEIPAEEQSPEHLINCKNGYLNWQEEEPVLEPHDPKFFFTVQVNANWDPNATCPITDTAFAEVLPYKGGVELIHEIFGYVLHNGPRSFQLAFLFEGGGENGKGIVMSRLTTLLSKKSYSTRALSELTNDRFATADLFGKALNVCGDIDTGLLENTDIFKKITGEDEFSAQHKHKRSFQFVNRAIPLFSANGYPQSRDKSHGWFRRWVVIPFPTSFAGRADIHLKTKMNTPEELDGLFVQAVDGLRRLMERKEFDIPKECLEAKEKFIQASDSAREFIYDQCMVIPGETSAISRAQLYDSYKGWCADTGRKAIRKKDFNDGVAKIMGIQLKKTTTQYVWVGLGWKPVGERERGFNQLIAEGAAGDSRNGL